MSQAILPLYKNPNLRRRNKMENELIPLPLDIPWKLIGVSPDMMDTQFCNKRFPFNWRSSLAIYAYEPKADDIPEELADKRITFLKVSCSITGYQPSKEETENGYTSFPDIPTEALDRIFGEYFACWGALLNVATFPTTKKVLKRHSIDFSDKELGLWMPHPYEEKGVTFEGVPHPPSHEVIDIYPRGGDGKGELNIGRIGSGNYLIVRSPASPRVEAKIVHYGPAAITMEARRLEDRTEEFVGSDTAGPQEGQIHELAVEGEKINKVVFKIPELPEGGQISLLEFAYYAWEEEPIDPGELEYYPHIIDFEPKMRDLYQSATESGELLTASKSEVNTNKSFTHTESTETGLSLAAKAFVGGKKDSSGEISGSLSHKWGETDKDSWTVETDASRERREKHASTTNLNQMYNLLTGYHAGTNRTTFLMLPRPHILQPTDHRTFVQGLRVIEGIQDFFLIVTRPKEVEGICVEAFLETGHFPEDVEIEGPAVEYEENHEDFFVSVYADTGASGDCEEIEDHACSTYTVSIGWVIDRSKGDSGHPGISEIANNSWKQADKTLRQYDYKPISDTTVQVYGRFCGKSWWRGGAQFARTYRVYTRSEQPKPSSSEPEVLTPFLITSRGLCASLKPEDKGQEAGSATTTWSLGDWVVDERKMAIPSILLRKDVVSDTKLPAMKEALRKIQSIMSTSWRLPSRQPFGEVGFLDSDYFKDQIKDLLPKETLETPLGEIADLDPRVVQHFGEQCTILEVLGIDLPTFAKSTGLSIRETLKARRKLLGLPKLPGKQG
jgi:hypothetical protein